ncbi:MAG TPA: putative nucleotide-diphospho-sugar transferase [Rhizomicrobium sp.]|nr:putative nucleotide-diphospho-sugar transferase [Rhizomicrobium sp.]
MENERYRLWREGGDPTAPFIVCAMFTPGYRSLAERLAQSLTHFSLAHALFEVEAVHRSINPRGSSDLAFSKPGFIRFLLERFSKPVLYVDADMVFRREPALIASLCNESCDFAIYNWLADPRNDAWCPDQDGRWRFFFSIDVESDSQLMASGGVQLWRATPAAVALLSAWERTIAGHPGAQDDHCLDFAFNHGGFPGLEPRWLPKEYCRHAFWPYVEAVIDHPQFPAPDAGQWKDLGIARLDRGKIRRAAKQQPFPRDQVLDRIP